jgi:DICT domain-containing protein
MIAPRNRRIPPVVTNFSIFDLAYARAQGSQTKNLGRLASISRREFEESETIVFSTTAPGLEYAGLLIEHALLLRTNRAGRVYANFGKLSSLRPIVDRYLRIADMSESVFVFGESDWKPPRHPNIRVVHLEHHFRIAHEWFLIVDSPTLKIALLARVDNESDPATGKRRLQAMKTSEPGIVTNLAEAVEGLIDWSLAA